MTAHDLRQSSGRALLLAGPRGSGTTSVAVAIGQLLDEARVPHAVIDLDGLCRPDPDLTPDQLTAMMLNTLATMTSRARLASLDGTATLVLARAVRSLDEVALLRAAVGGALVALRLSVPPAITAARLRLHDTSDDTDSAVVTLAQGRLHLPAVSNHGRSPVDTAHEVLHRVGWIRRTTTPMST